MWRWMAFIFAAISLACHVSGSPFSGGPFKKCADMGFCNHLRYNQLTADKKFKADFSTLVTKNDEVHLDLKNGQNQRLILQITWHNQVARLKIAEPNSNRFALMTGFALHKEPVKTGLKAAISQTKLVITNSLNSNRIEIQNNPAFSLHVFNIHNQEVMELQGDRLVMDNTNVSKAFAFGVDFKATMLYGLFDHAHKLALTQTAHTDIDPFRLRNADEWGYRVNTTTALYGTVPVIYGHKADQTSGIFLHNAAEQWVDISYSNKDPNAYFMVDTASFDLFFLFGPTPTEVVRQFTSLTGTAPLPQLWTLGYHQCRHAYKSQEEVKMVVALFEKGDFPLDAIWLDDLHTDAYRYFKWNASTFSDPVEMQKNISHYGKVAVSISDPHFKIDPNYHVYAGAKGKYFVRKANGEDFIGYSWPGAASWIDFLNPEAADYYSSWYAYNKFNGSTPVIAGIWNDMNEPSLFTDSTERTFPFDVVHRIDNKGTKVVHRELHNIFGLSHVKATYKGLLARDNNKKRPFILTRSHFAGSQRYAAMWTGDNSPTWEHFAISISQCLTGNILGMVFCGADVAGFGGNPTPELLQRWFQGAIWLPFFRGHSETWTQRREPYVFPEAIQKVLRSTLKLRYAHIPYLYTLFYQHSVHGDPVISPLFYRYPGIQERDSQILVGEALMAVPVVKPSVPSVEVLFPGDKNQIWYRVDRPNVYETHLGGSTAQVSVDIATSPLFYKGGSIVMTYADVKTSTARMQHTDLMAYVNLDSTGKAVGTYYVDDYTSFDHITKEEYIYYHLQSNSTGDHYSVVFTRIGGKSQQFKTAVKQIVVRKPKTLDNLKAVEITFDKTRDGTRLNTIAIKDGMVLEF